VDGTDLVQDRGLGRGGGGLSREHGNEPLGSMKYWEVLE
jgi:hypothetical protein